MPDRFLSFVPLGVRLLPAGVVALAGAIASHQAAAQDSPNPSEAESRPDHVWLEPPRPTPAESDWYPRPIERVSGTIVRFDNEQLRLKKRGGDPEWVVAAARVLWVEREDATELELEALRLYEQQRYSESLAKLPAVLKQRPPVWRQQWLTMVGANAAWKCGRGKISLELVSQLDKLPLPPMVVGWLPIAWQNGPPGADAASAALDRLQDPSPATRLVAASWLLSSPQRRQAIETVRGLLGSDERPELASLARCLLWRTATPPEVIESAAVWERELDALPMALQTGPTLTLAEKLRTAGQSAQADRLDWSLELTPIRPR